MGGCARDQVSASEQARKHGERDFLREYLAQAPLALALPRAIECCLLSEWKLERPVLDIGCGDGLFVQVLGLYPEVGLDLSPRELRSAANRGSHCALVCADVAALPFREGCFATILANGVLEHVRDLIGGLREMARVLKPGGRLIFTVPLGEETLLPGRVSDGFWGRWLARLYGRAYNRVFDHVNLLTAQGWGELLARNGLELVYQRTYGSKEVLRTHRLMLPASLPSLLYKRFTGRWVFSPALRRATWGALWAGLLREQYARASATGGMCLLGIARPSLGDVAS